VGTIEWSSVLDWHDDSEMIAKVKVDFRVNDCADAGRRYAQFKSDMMAFLRDRDVVLCPVNGLSALPFDIEEYPTLTPAATRPRTTLRAGPLRLSGRAPPTAVCPSECRSWLGPAVRMSLSRWPSTWRQA
jgi:hypothetical protein